jgi:hypothetical protein
MKNPAEMGDPHGGVIGGNFFYGCKKLPDISPFYEEKMGSPHKNQRSIFPPMTPSHPQKYRAHRGTRVPVPPKKITARIFSLIASVIRVIPDVPLLMIGILTPKKSRHASGTPGPPGHVEEPLINRL